MWIALAVGCSTPDGTQSPDDGDVQHTEDTDVGTPPTGDPGLLQFDGEVPRNLLIVSLDTMRRDYVGRYGSGPETPRLDEFLAESIVLDEHWSCSNWTSPSMTCVVAGTMPAASGFWPLSEDLMVPAFPPADFETLSSRLSAVGFDTRLLTANRYFGTLTGLEKGFDEVVEPGWDAGGQLSELAIETVAELLAVPETPWYLHVHYSDPHGPYCPPAEFIDTTGLPPFDGDICEDFEPLRIAYWSQPPEWQDAYRQWALAYYAAEVASWDVAFGALVDGLEAMGAFDDTLVVFVTDHGEQMGERNAWGHGILLGTEETRSIAAFKSPGLEPRSWTGTTYHADLAVTLHDLYGVLPTDLTMDGMVVGTASDERSVRSGTSEAASASRSTRSTGAARPRPT
jgi:arylsulfatase A-like enzyme